MKRAYKLQEFVAHTSNVNCLKIGKKSSRVLVTGGEDHKVNMWAIGKPNAILSLSGHSSAVESVTFDSSEALVVAGAASGTIKLWDLEEAKLVRNLTGHRSNCISVDFHPFGEFFASGSLDTNLKIWDIRRKTCIHTYKGHTRGVNAIKFSPDGRWVVSGGEDNVVKLWDLTAGKLMHDFKSHEGQIHCVDFHPQEFLLATGSADRTVRFWDLETFELIGTAGPETSGVRSMIFNPDGRTLLAGLHESLKVFSWEPLRSFDAVDVGWSKLADLNVHEGKLLGCSYNQSCVGVWVVDISRVGPYASVSIPRTNGANEAKPVPGGHQPSQQVESSLKSSVARLSLSHSSEQGIKETKPSSMAGENVPATPHRVGVSLPLKNHPAAAPASTASYALTPKRNTTSKVQPTANFQSTGRSVDVAPIIVPRSSSTRADTSTDAKRETCNIGRTATAPPLSRSIDMAKAGSNRDEPDKAHSSFHSVPLHQKRTAGNEKSDQDFCRAEQSFSPRSEPSVPNPVMSNEGSQSGIRWMGAPKLKRNPAGDSLSVVPDRSSSLQWPPSVVESGRARALVESWEKREKPIGDMHSLGSGRSLPISGNDSSSVMQRGGIQAFESDKSASEENVSVEELIEQHSTITSILQTRLTKLQVIKRFWQRNDLKGAIEALKKMGDHSVSSDIISALNERSEVFNLDICIVALPLLTRMLESEAERHLSVTLDTLLMIMKMFGDVIRSTMAAAPTIGVDLHAEQRVEKCKSCYTELQKIKQRLNPLTRKGGAISKSAQELSSALQEF